MQSGNNQSQSLDAMQVGWCGAKGTVDNVPVEVVDTVDSRYEAPVIALGVGGQLPAAVDYLARVMATDDEAQRKALLAGDVLVVKDAIGERRIVHASEVSRVERSPMDSRAAVLGGRPTTVAGPGQTSPRGVVVSDSERQEVDGVLASGRLGLGRYQRLAAERFSKAFGIRHVQLAANGSVVLGLAMDALGIGEGDEVLAGAETFQATVGALYDKRVAAVQVDCLPGNLTIDPDAVEAYLRRCVAEGRRLPKAVIAIALYWQLPALARLRSICDRYSDRLNEIKLVFDFAHGPYAELGGLPATRFADVVTYSFQQSKSLSLGEGGAIATDDDELAPALAMAVSCGYMPWDQVTDAVVGGLVLDAASNGVGFKLPARFRQRQSVNYRMAEVQAAQLYVRLETFMQTFEKAVANIELLQQVVRRHADILEAYNAVPDARGPFYKWGFRVRPEWMPADIFRWAARKQTGVEWIFCYPALTQADQRNPLIPAALEGLVNDEYFKAITRRFDVPNAEGALDVTALAEWAWVAGDNPAESLESMLSVFKHDRRLVIARA